MNNYIYIFIAFFTILSQVVMAQNVGIGTITPHASAKLDIESTTKGILIPRMSNAQRTAIASPAKGLLVFDNTTNSFWFYNGTAWQDLGTGADNLGDHIATQNIQLNGNWLSNDGGNEGVFVNTTGSVGIGTATPAYPLTLGASGGVLGVENTAVFLAKNSSGTYENFLFPRWSDNIMYMNYGSGGFNIRNNTNVSSMFMTNGGNVGIGTTAPTARFSVGASNQFQVNTTGDITKINNVTTSFPISQGVANTVLQNDGTGNLSWATVAPASDTMPLIQDADRDTRVWVEKNPDDDTIRFDIAGIEKYRFISNRLEFLTDTDIRIGKNAGFNTPSVNSIILGNETGASNFSHRESVIIGHNTAVTNQTSIGNVIIGHDAFKGAGGTTSGGSDAVIIGRHAAGNLSNVRPDRSVIIGATAMQNFSGTGFNIDDNIAIGYGAMRNFSGIQRNIAIGKYAMRNATGLARANVAIGAYAGHNAANIDNIYIGDYAGYNNTGTANVFIGHDVGFNETGSNLLYIDNSNTTTPLIWGDFANNRLVINGNAASNSNNRTFFSNGQAGGTTAWFNDSDRRLKKNISTIQSPLQKIQELRGVNYEWKDSKNHHNGLRMGFIAQEVLAIVPEVVDSTGGHYSMQYAPLTALLVEAVKEQQTQISQLQSKNEALTAQLGELEKLKSEIEDSRKQIENIKGILKTESNANKY